MTDTSSTQPLATPAPAPAVPAGGEDTARSFLDKAADLLGDLLEVRVITGVGDLGVSLTDDHGATTVSLDDSQHKITQSIVTIVKLKDGDVTMVIAEELLDNADLRALHAAQVKESLEVLPRNLKALVHIAGEIIEAIRKL